MTPQTRYKRNRERKTGKEQYYTNACVVDRCVSLAKPFVNARHYQGWLNRDELAKFLSREEEAE